VYDCWLGDVFEQRLFASYIALRSPAIFCLVKDVRDFWYVRLCETWLKFLGYNTSATTSRLTSKMSQGAERKADSSSIMYVLGIVCMSPISPWARHKQQRRWPVLL